MTFHLSMEMSKVLRSITIKQTLSPKFNKNFARNISFIYFRNAKQISKYKNFRYSNATSRYLSPIFSTSKRFYSDDLPSHTKVLLPALSPTMDMGTIVSWAKKEGDKLNEGDLLAEIETDKATMGFETPDEGYLAKILVSAGTRDVPIGKLVCIIVEEEKDIAAFKDFVDDSIPTKTAVSPPSSTPESSGSTTPPLSKSSPLPIQTASAPQSQFSKSSDRIFASPLARRLASEQGVDLSTIGTGSGIFGSFKAKDLKKASRSVSVETGKIIAGYGFEDRPVSSVSGARAKNALQSKQTIPHYYLTVDVTVDEIVKLKKKLNESLEKEGVQLTLNDFIIKATALASKKVPEANSAWMDTFIRQYNTVDVSVVLSMEKGVITPVVFDSDKKGLIEISNDLRKLALKAADGTLQSHEFQGGTISVSNLGMFNIKSISSIISPPQACILSMGSIQKRLVPDKSEQNGMKVSDFIQFTLSCDHRVVDGAVGAQWLTAFRKLIEDPHNMLL